MGGADDGGQAHHDNRPEHDEVHDDARRCGRPGGVRVHARPQRRPVRAEGPGGHARHPRHGPEGDLLEGRPEIRGDGGEGHRHEARGEAVRDPRDQGGDGQGRRYG